MPHTEFKKAFKVKAEKNVKKKFEGREHSVDGKIAQLRQARATLQFFVKKGNLRAPQRLADADKILVGLEREFAAAQALGAQGQYDAAYEQLGPIKTNAEKGLQYVVDARDELLFQDPDNLIEIKMGKGWKGPAPKVHPASIKGFDMLDEGAAEEAFRVVGKKLQDGRQLLDRLLTDPEYASDPDVAPALKDVTDLMWYLRNKAEEAAGAAFEKGALSIPDDGNLLRGYFDRCTEVYNRYSSHIKAQQDKAGGTARAVDAYEGDVVHNPDGLLPYSMNTMLVQSLKMEGTGEQRLYIKLETEGSRYGAPTASAATGGLLRPTDKGKRKALEVDPQMQQDRAGIDAATLPTSRDALPADMERTVEHGKNLVRTIVGAGHHGKLKGFKRFAEDAIDGKKADLVKDTPYAAIVKAVAALGSSELSGIVEDGNYKAEINQMVANLERLAGVDMNDYLRPGVKSVDAKLDAVDQGVAAFIRFLEAHGLSDNKESRVGSEVVLSADFLKPAGLDSASVAVQLLARLKDMKQRDAEDLLRSRLQGLIDGALSSMARAKNFLKDAAVRDAAEELEKEVVAVRDQIARLTRFDAQWALDRLHAQTTALRNKIDQFDADVLDIGAKQAQELYDDALRAAFEVHQLGHLADDEAVTRAVEDVAARADSFIDIIAELESREKKA